MGAVLWSSWYAVRITLHRNFIPIKGGRQIPEALGSYNKAVIAARSCTHLLPHIKKSMVPSHHLAFFMQYFFSSVVIILLCAVNSTDENTAAAPMKEAEDCLEFLAELENIWPGTKKCREVLNELSSSALEAMQRGNTRRWQPMASLHPPMVPQSPPVSRPISVQSPLTNSFPSDVTRPSHSEHSAFYSRA